MCTADTGVADSQNDLHESVLSLRECQLAALDILKVIDAICAKEGFRYYLAYGTAIGAVRHGGFIPWDDDVDVMMPRPDYEALITYFRKHAKKLEPLVLLHTEKARRLPFLIARISDMTYQMIGECGTDVDELGAFVDVYPLDGLGDDYSAAVSSMRIISKQGAKAIRAANFASYKRGNALIKNVAKSLYSLVLGNPERHYGDMKKSLKAVGKTYDESRFVGVPIWSKPEWVYERDWFGSPPVVPFEGIECPLPADTDSVLSIQYGDYMKLPPENERIPHHIYSLIRREPCCRRA